jgi:pilus assembly protein Flp/PilA
MTPYKNYNAFVISTGDKVSILQVVCNRRSVSICIATSRLKQLPLSDRDRNNIGKETTDMNSIKKILFGLNSDKRAVTALEYAMIASLIAVAAVTAIGGVSGKLNATLTSISSAL